MKNIKWPIVYSFFCLLSIWLVCFSNIALAEEIESVGEFTYGPEVSELVACKLAEQKAKENAVRLGVGEIVSGHQLLRCRETGDKEKCLLNQSTWSEAVGLVRSARKLSKEILVSGKEHKTCKITIKALVGQYRGKRDPSFDFSVRLNRSDNIFRENDSIEFFISPLTKMYITIFLWDPYDGSGEMVERIFPNDMDRNNLFVFKGKIPTIFGGKEYKFFTKFPDNAREKRKYIDQYVSVVGTRKQVKFKDRYRREELNNRLLELPAKDWRIQRFSYFLVKGKSKPD